MEINLWTIHAPDVVSVDFVSHSWLQLGPGRFYLCRKSQKHFNFYRFAKEFHFSGLRMSFKVRKSHFMSISTGYLFLCTFCSFIPFKTPSLQTCWTSLIFRSKLNIVSELFEVWRRMEKSFSFKSFVILWRTVQFWDSLWLGLWCSGHVSPTNLDLAIKFVSSNPIYILFISINKWWY